MHLVPEKFDLQLHTPLELHDVEVDPDVLHPQAEKYENVSYGFSKNWNVLTFTLAVGKSIIT